MLRDLRLRDFRCFAQLDFEPAPGLNFIIGPNAQGKTSILEAACVLLRLQSPRAASLADAVRFDQPGFGLDGHWQDRHMHVKFTDALKSFALDSLPQSRSNDYLGVARVAWISNDDLQLVRGSGTPRRRYLDFLGTQITPNYLRHLRAYERALRSRNALLKDNRPRREIAAFDGPLVEAGNFLLAARQELCASLQPQIAAAHREISGGREVVATAYQPSGAPDLAAALEAARDEEIRLRATTVGPHRDDLAILLHDRKASAYASEGQQRSIALALKLGQARVIEERAQTPPLFLIDDVFGELDATRRNNLLAALPPAAQKIVTATSLDWRGAGAEGAIFLLHDGRLEKKSHDGGHISG